MAKQEKKKVSRIKVIKKSWCRIIAPKVFGDKDMGEMYVASAEKALGRVLHYNLKELTGNVRDQNAYLTFSITHKSGDALQTALTGYELTTGSVKRMVRKNTNRLDDYIIVKTKSGQKVVIKVLLITLHKTQRSVQARLRKELHAVLLEEMEKGDFVSFMEKVVNGSLRALVQKRLHAIYPVREIAIKSLKLKEGEASVDTPEKEVEKVVAAPEAAAALPA